MLLFIIPVHVLATPTAEQVKAAYVYKFTQFVIWPDAFFSHENPIKICVLGDDEISRYLQSSAIRSMSDGLIDIEVFSSISETLDCRIVYISDSEQLILDKVLLAYKNRAILTVSSIAHFARKGGMIGFVQEGGRVRLEINNLSAQQENIRLNGKLLEVAHLVDDVIEAPTNILFRKIPVTLPESVKETIQEVQP